MTVSAAIVRVGALALVFFLLPARASAFVATSGDTIKPHGTIQKQFEGTVPSRLVGFKYSYWGILWVDFWTYEGTWCLYKDKMYWPLTPAQAAELLGVSESALQPPFWYQFPPGLPIAGVIIVIALIVKLVERKKPKPVQTLLEDPVYQSALMVFHERMATTEPVTSPEPAVTPPISDEASQQAKMASAYQAAIAHLTSNGVPLDQAEANLPLLLSATQPVPPT
jgi:hypothetical protein